MRIVGVAVVLILHVGFISHHLSNKAKSGKNKEKPNGNLRLDICLGLSA
jgi:hypothetical protein